MCRKLGEEEADKEKIIAAQKLYEWIEIGNDHPILFDCTEKFVSRGSYQQLANENKVGWHPDFLKPDFLKKLKAVLEEEK